MLLLIWMMFVTFVSSEATTTNPNPGLFLTSDEFEKSRKSAIASHTATDSQLNDKFDPYLLKWIESIHEQFADDKCIPSLGYVRVLNAYNVTQETGNNEPSLVTFIVEFALAAPDNQACRLGTGLAPVCFVSIAKPNVSKEQEGTNVEDEVDISHIQYSKCAYIPINEFKDLPQWVLDLYK